MEELSRQFVPYKLALKLKELGFKDKGLGFSYMRFKCEGVENAYVEKVVPNYLYNGWDLLCIAPLWQQAWEFLQIKYCFDFNITCNLTYEIVLIDGSHNPYVFSSSEQYIVMEDLLSKIEKYWINNKWEI